MCNRHPFLLSENLCGRCGQEFCQECLVHPAGQRLPLCMTCAVAAAGARVGPKALSRRQINALVKQRRAEQSAGAPRPLPAITNPVPTGFAFDADAAEPLDAPAPQATTPEAEGRRRGRRRGRDEAAGRDTTIGPPAAVRDEMISWLDSVYATGPVE